MFAYCNNSPISYFDSTGCRMVHASCRDEGGFAYNQADISVIDNKETIIDAAEKYNVDPNVLAACIYVEQFYNYNLIDKLTDVPLFFADTSVGIGQVKISTANMLVDIGLVPAIGDDYTNYQMAQTLQNDDVYNINCAAAYLNYLSSYWEDEYNVSEDAAIWGTLYNMGPLTPHGQPEPNWFGEKVAGYYWYMELLLN